MKIKRILAAALILTSAMGVTANAKNKVNVGKPAETEILTEATTEAASEAITELAEKVTTSDIPTDEYGNPLTGKDLICYNTLKKYAKWGAKPIEATYSETSNTESPVQAKQKNIKFGSGDFFWVRRYNFTDSSEERYSENIFIPGDTVEIRAFDFNTTSWFYTLNIANEIPKQVVFLDTDKYHMVLGLPAVYKNNEFTCNTLTIVPEQEQPIKLTKADGGYNVNFSFPHSPDYIGEIWCLESSRVLTDWNNSDVYSLIRLDLASNRRFCYDGYYFQTPDNYSPGGANVLYRQPSNYTGSAMINYNNIPTAYDLGYVTTYICAGNQNDEGFWPTGPQSGWLYSDFGITAGFYDTRFNTDFASNLIEAYRLYYDEYFLKALLAYGDFFNAHAAVNHYETENGGWLIEDYRGQEGYTRTHCSLNHLLAEMDVLYKLSYITGVKSYKETADNMLKGIEDTKEDWIMPDGNLYYALYYSGTLELTDYPYLTYNDLYTTQQILNTYWHYTNATLDELMATKKKWMDANNITGYYTTQQVVK